MPSKRLNTSTEFCCGSIWGGPLYWLAEFFLAWSSTVGHRSKPPLNDKPSGDAADHDQHGDTPQVVGGSSQSESRAPELRVNVLHVAPIAILMMFALVGTIVWLLWDDTPDDNVDAVNPVDAQLAPEDAGRTMDAAYFEDSALPQDATSPPRDAGRISRDATMPRYEDATPDWDATSLEDVLPSPDTLPNMDGRVPSHDMHAPRDARQLDDAGLRPDGTSSRQPSRQREPPLPAEDWNEERYLEVVEVAGKEMVGAFSQQDDMVRQARREGSVDLNRQTATQRGQAILLFLKAIERAEIPRPSHLPLQDAEFQAFVAIRALRNYEPELHVDLMRLYRKTVGKTPRTQGWTQ